MSTRKELAAMFRLNWLRTIYIFLTCVWAFVIAATFTFIS